MILLNPVQARYPWGATNRKNPPGSDQESGDRQRDERSFFGSNEKLRVDAPSGRSCRPESIPSVQQALQKLYALDFRRDFAQSNTSDSLVRSSSLVAERILHFTLNQ
ncbi:MAG: hypothetical protein VX969_03230 [Verrucomicrobiota bacterium]|nr:hypothetical protein [Verrucomicrobiota bacterium]